MIKGGFLDEGWKRLHTYDEQKREEGPINEDL